MDNQLRAFLDDLKSTHGGNLVSVVLYGSAAAGDFVPRASDYNLLVALEKITPLELRNANACTREWARLGHPVPVYFTVDELKTAADVFPIEFHQMERARRVLYGTDVLADLKISDDFLRHQTEYELRSRLIQLRRSYIPASQSVNGLVNLMAESLTSFAALFRALLLLKKIEPPTDKHSIIARTVLELELDGKPFEKIFNIRENNFEKNLTEVSANELFAEYMEQIERAIAAVDRMRDS
ncbi:MAG: nucleotidyltransferase domain-containing protein [Acidobacteria bacterium]|nr:nucleotidyltransferase domain-containing protein [Acidobacteriota bacterium]MBK8147867.1 nucleotidyltransferase domain-containing protein [Acidobacteriota bacterium]MBK8812154.1 nucleotidyltransferase domain-containing protein [Acidobacteriota bacterium]